MFINDVTEDTLHDWSEPASACGIFVCLRSRWQCGWWNPEELFSNFLAKVGEATIRTCQCQKWLTVVILAIRLIPRCCELQPLDPACHYAKALVLEARKNFKAAINSLKTALSLLRITLSPDSPGASFLHSGEKEWLQHRCCLTSLLWMNHLPLCFRWPSSWDAISFTKIRPSMTESDLDGPAIKSTRGNQ